MKILLDEKDLWELVLSTEKQLAAAGLASGDSKTPDAASLLKSL